MEQEFESFWCLEVSLLRENGKIELRPAGIVGDSCSKFLLERNFLSLYLEAGEKIECYDEKKYRQFSSGGLSLKATNDSCSGIVLIMSLEERHCSFSMLCMDVGIKGARVSFFVQTRPQTPIISSLYHEFFLWLSIETM